MRKLMIPRAAYLTAALLLSGHGHAEDFQDAVTAYQRAHYGAALSKLTALAEQGDARAQADLGTRLLQGHEVPMDIVAAEGWLKRAAEQGDGDAAFQLGQLYFSGGLINGRGVQQNFSESAKWYRVAASKGSVLAQGSLGNMYTAGMGVPQNFVQAYMWLTIASGRATPDQLAVYAANRNRLAAQMPPGLIADAQARAGICERSGWMDCGEPQIILSGAPTIQRLAPNDGAGRVTMVKQGGVYTVPVAINGVVTINFIVDSGAADVLIPADVVSTLFRAGALKAEDFIGTKNYQIADGSVVPSRTFRIKSLKVGDVTVENVMGSVASSKAEGLLGQSFLSRLRTWSVDNASHELVLR